MGIRKAIALWLLRPELQELQAELKRHMKQTKTLTTVAVKAAESAKRVSQSAMRMRERQDALRKPGELSELETIF